MKRNKERAGPGMVVLGETGIREENMGEKDEDEWGEQGMALMIALGPSHGSRY